MSGQEPSKVGGTTTRLTYPRHRFPAEIISHAVWLYHVFSLSLRDVELILAYRGVIVSHKSIRHWCQKFDADSAKRLRKRRPKPGDTWHLDEVFIQINGTLHCLWRAVDQHGAVLDIFVQDRRNAEAAERFFMRLLQGLQYKPRGPITDGLRSYGVAHREVMPNVRHRTNRYLNNRAENSHLPEGESDKCNGSSRRSMRRAADQLCPQIQNDPQLRGLRRKYSRNRA